MIKTLQVRKGEKEAFNGPENKSLCPESSISVGTELILSFRSISNIDKEFAKGMAGLWKCFRVNWTGTFLSVDTEDVLKGQQRKSSYRVNAKGIRTTEHPWNSRVQLKQRSIL